ncbi:Glycosyltransferase, GT2 family [Paraoerskovia marina]|uniref:Glycosyltransferase, GT2 family n=1 Tax=Paraoerskovia marina TaxID=545619 RepID=A0A1H1QUY4_9CELL|nr:Glycosyltransferase, GT2 family [Paraoerskovia marina]
MAFNRADLLREALDALAGQDRPVDAVLVVDNASTDHTARVAVEHPSGPVLLTLPRNTGGAGGFAVGMAHAVRRLDADLVWVMDDDTIPGPHALAGLLEAREASPVPVTILGSRVEWVDGREHPMNTPRRRPYERDGDTVAGEATSSVPVRSSSFVSMMIDGGAIRRFGLPVADYFIWNDDFEYSARLLRDGTGLHVPTSVVEHRTKVFGATDVDPGERFYYEVRNKVWMITRSSALTPGERVLYTGAAMRRWARTVSASKARGVLVRAGSRGLRDGALRRPKSSTTVLAGMGDVSDDVAAVERGAGRA